MVHCKAFQVHDLQYLSVKGLLLLRKAVVHSAKN